MRTFHAAVATVMLMLAGCGSQQPDEVVDTTLNETQPNSAALNELPPADGNIEATELGAQEAALYESSGDYYGNAEPSYEIETPVEDAQPQTFEAARAVSRSGPLSSLLSGDDYPQSALMNGEQGDTTVQLAISTNGRVAGCAVTRSSGSPVLDSATCRILQSRARFTPARDEAGNAAADEMSTTIHWRLD